VSSCQSSRCLKRRLADLSSYRQCSSNSANSRYNGVSTQSSSVPQLESCNRCCKKRTSNIGSKGGGELPVQPCRQHGAISSTTTTYRTICFFFSKNSRLRFFLVLRSKCLRLGARFSQKWPMFTKQTRIYADSLESSVICSLASSHLSDESEQPRRSRLPSYTG